MASMQQSFEAGQKKGQAQETAEQWTESAKETMGAARDKAADATQATKESAQHGQEQASGFLQQTGEQMKSMAQGAVEGVKNTLGMNNNNNK